MATLSTRTADDSIEKLAESSSVSRALTWIEKNSDWITEQQIKITEIPAPEFEEARRGDYVKTVFPGERPRSSRG